MSRFSRTVSWLCALALFGVALAAPAGAAQGGQPSPARPGAVAAAGGAEPVSRHTITLITGDVIGLSKYPDGRQLATAEPNRSGRPPLLEVLQVGGDVYAIPLEAQRYVAAGRLDRRLFNLTDLVAAGDDDAKRKDLPIIVSYGTGLRAASAAVPAGGTRTRTLPSLNGAAVSVDKRSAAAFWEAIDDDTPSPRAAAQLEGGIAKVWLDGPVHALLDRSVPQVGAPEAWADGFDGRGVPVAVLDTGMDSTHPDLAGQIAKATSFVPDEPDPVDSNRHGTHVASIVAGTGAASDGARKGVAPGARLYNGKVLNLNGDGEESWVLAGMEWAVAEGAKIVSMSLGGAPTDGTDPLAQAVDRLSQTGTLFVIAAGNGGADETVTSPASASAALAVGAVDRDDSLASFSSRGPRVGDGAIKPDITAPGVGIQAAYANIPEDVFPWHPYGAFSGTSMATPHVAGAAAILAQQHPDWSGPQLKAALLSSAKPNPANSVYQQGAGRLDVGQAHRQQVHVSAGSVDFGFFKFPQKPTDPPVAKTLTYTNDGATAVTLDLAVAATTQSGAPAPDGTFSLDRTSAQVPAGGSATVTVTYRPTVGDPGLYGGWITASAAGGTLVRTAIGADKEPERYDVTVPVIGRDGKPVQANIFNSTVVLFGLDQPLVQDKPFTGGAAPVFRVPPGRYSVDTLLFGLDPSGRVPVAEDLLVKPEFEVRADTTVALDARKAREVRVATPKPSESRNVNLGYFRSTGDLSLLHGSAFGWPVRVSATPTGRPVTVGEMEFLTKWDLLAPEIRASVHGPHAGPLQVASLSSHIHAAPMIDGRRLLEVTDAGEGRPEDFAGRDVRGRLALLQRSAAISLADQVANAARAGAVAALVVNDQPGLMIDFLDGPPIPALWTTREEGQRLHGLLQRGPLRLELRGTAVSPYSYEGLFPERGRIPDRLQYEISPRTAARIDASYHATSPLYVRSVRWFIRPYMSDIIFFGVNYFDPAPLRREEWISGGDSRWVRAVDQLVDPDWLNAASARWNADVSTYRAGQRLTETWFDVVRGGAPGNASIVDATHTLGYPAYREDDFMRIWMPGGIDGSGGHYSHCQAGDACNDTMVSRLYRDGRLVHESGHLNSFEQWPAVPERARYTLTYDLTRTASWLRTPVSSHTEWTFTSQRPASGRQLLPLLHVDYDLGLDLRNQAPELTTHQLQVTLRHQPGVSGPALTGIKAWASFDDGATWQPVAVSPTGSGHFTIRVRHPRAASTSGHVGLRVQGSDADGNQITQTIPHTYDLTTRTP